ncbi:MAG: helix-turn-helix domain-containing protein [Calothrix sp. MO_167.B12]|nr:helix-turn-helix domain-containing protein [Calothrix sp. MO_167.B12]
MPLPKRSSRCAFESLLTLLTGTWTLYIIWVLVNNGATRFGELKRKVEGISARVLTDRLRLLEDANLVYRDYQPTIPPQVTYSLTERAMDLIEVFDKLEVVAQKWYAEEESNY